MPREPPGDAPTGDVPTGDVPTGDSFNAAAARPEMGDAPPFATWPRIYLLVIGALAAQIALYAALTAAYR